MGFFFEFLRYVQRVIFFYGDGILFFRQWDVEGKIGKGFIDRERRLVYLCKEYFFFIQYDFVRLCFWNWGFVMGFQEDFIGMSFGVFWSIFDNIYGVKGLRVFRKGEMKIKVCFKEGVVKYGSFEVWSRDRGFIYLGLRVYCLFLIRLEYKFL